MTRTLTHFRCCDAYLRSTATAASQESASAAKPLSAATARCVLIVEFRDEVFADLKFLFENHGFDVTRALAGATVVQHVVESSPALILINENMPLESGWLITCKLRLTDFRQPVWIYTARQPRLPADWQRFCGVNEIIPYGGVLACLNARVSQHIKGWQSSSDANVSRGAASTKLTKCAY